MAATKRQQILGHKLHTYSGAGTPTDGTSGTGAGRAEPGSLYIDTTASMGRIYRNEGTKASPVWTLTGKITFLFTAGHNGAGAVTFTGAKVGDKVVMAYNVTTPGTAAANFETTITVADQIQQSSATNLSAVNHIFLIQR